MSGDSSTPRGWRRPGRTTRSTRRRGTGESIPDPCSSSRSRGYYLLIHGRVGSTGRWRPRPRRSRRRRSAVLPQTPSSCQNTLTSVVNRDQAESRWARRLTGPGRWPSPSSASGTCCGRCHLAAACGHLRFIKRSPPHAFTLIPRILQLPTCDLRGLRCDLRGRRPAWTRTDMAGRGLTGVHCCAAALWALPGGGQRRT